MHVSESFHVEYVNVATKYKCLEEKKTISEDDLMWAMTTLGFEDYIKP